jgi:outer membrane protein OmpA-like peptidoglycan-associated protein
VFNQRLSRRRAEAARDYLVSLGFPRTSIEVVAVGEERPILETPDGVAELQNRYVMIEELPTPAEAARRANTIPPHPIC